jgi:hypothetical protein
MPGIRGNLKPTPARGENVAVRETVRKNLGRLVSSLTPPLQTGALGLIGRAYALPMLGGTPKVDMSCRQSGSVMRSSRSVKETTGEITPLHPGSGCNEISARRAYGDLARSDRRTGTSRRLHVVRRDKPACCRGCKSPTGKETATPSWPRVLHGTSRGVS